MNSNSSIIAGVVQSEAFVRASAVQRDLASRRKLAAEKCPEALRLEKEINDTALEFSRKIIESPADAAALNALASDIIAGKRGQMQHALEQKGFPGDYLEVKHICPVCCDTGYTKGGVCACMRQAVINARFKGSGVNPNENFEVFRFDLLKDPKQQRAMRRIYDYCRGYADNFPNNEHRDLLLIGEPGVGKTYLLNCMGGRVLANGASVLKLNTYRLIQLIMESFRDEPENKPDFLMPELLIIDDLGAEPMLNNVTIESLLSIICERQDRGLATLCATNHSPDELAERYGSRLTSRLIAPRSVKVITVETENVRLVNK